MPQTMIRYTDGRMSRMGARQIALSARRGLKARLFKCMECEREAASLPAGSQRRDVLLRLAHVERESVREQAPVLERAIGRLNAELIECGIRPIGRDE